MLDIYQKLNVKYLKSYILYKSTMLPQAQSQFRLDKVNGHPVKLSFGFGGPGKNETGAIFGTGVEMSGDRQLFRINYDFKGKMMLIAEQ